MSYDYGGPKVYKIVKHKQPSTEFLPVIPIIYRPLWGKVQLRLTSWSMGIFFLHSVFPLSYSNEWVKVNNLFPVLFAVVQLFESHPGCLLIATLCLGFHWTITNVSKALGNAAFALSSNTIVGSNFHEQLAVAARGVKTDVPFVDACQEIINAHWLTRSYVMPDIKIAQCDNLFECPCLNYVVHTRVWWP